MEGGNVGLTSFPRHRSERPAHFLRHGVNEFWRRRNSNSHAGWPGHPGRLLVSRCGVYSAGNHPSQELCKRRDEPPMKPESAHLRGNLRLCALGLVPVLAVGGILASVKQHETKQLQGAEPSSGSNGDATSERSRVDVIHPLLGQMPRSISEPGTVKAFDYADLYAKVSGYLQEQNVDIGDSVTPGQLLAKLFAPELVQAVEQSKAELAQAQAQRNLAEASIDRAKADVKAADSRVNEKQADFKRATAYLAFRQIEYERIRDLYSLRAIEEKLVDQNVKERDAALEARNAAKAAIQTAQSDLDAKKAKVAEAQADLANASAKIDVTKAVLAKAAVFVNYLEIRSPYKGVITERSFHVGDFIRAAGPGERIPVLIVAETDKMRVVMKMPEAYVRYTAPGNSAVVELDALAGREFHAKVSRIGNSLDPIDRTMRVEVDLENTANQLRDGMFGRVTVQLMSSKDEMSIPSTCIVSSAEGSTPSVYVVRNEHVQLIPVKIDRDTGVQAEVLSGLAPNDLVVLHPSGDLLPGSRVEAVLSKVKAPSPQLER
jgi:HlyD family secretion protein